MSDLKDKACLWPVSGNLCAVFHRRDVKCELTYRLIVSDDRLLLLLLAAPW